MLPVNRSIDFAKDGEGKIIVEENIVTVYIYIFIILLIQGEKTKFTSLSLLDSIEVNRQIIGIDKIISDTCLYLKSKINKNIEKPITYQIVPHLSNKDLYPMVFKSFENDQVVSIFPEGGSHDRPTLLPFKYGCASIPLSYMSNVYNNIIIVIKIV